MAPDAADTAFRTALQLDANVPLEDRMGFGDVPGWDSLGHMRLVLEIEKIVGRSLEMEEIVAIDTVGAVRRLISPG